MMFSIHFPGPGKFRTRASIGPTCGSAYDEAGDEVRPEASFAPPSGRAEMLGAGKHVGCATPMGHQRASTATAT